MVLFSRDADDGLALAGDAPAYFCGGPTTAGQGKPSDKKRHNADPHPNLQSPDMVGKGRIHSIVMNGRRLSIYKTEKMALLPGPAPTPLL